MQQHKSIPRYKPPLLEEIHGHEVIQKALWDSEGDINTASIKIGCGKSALYDYMDRIPESKQVRDEAKKHFKRAKVEEREKLLYALNEQKKNAPVSFSSIKYYLDTHGKEEGWGAIPGGEAEGEKSDALDLFRQWIVSERDKTTSPSASKKLEE